MSGNVFVSPYNPTQQSGCRAKNPPDMIIASSSPTTKSIGYLNGTFWLHVGNSLWFLESQVGGASPSANWVQLTTASGGVLPVSQGGTGRSTLTAHGVLLGEGTSAINQSSAGISGQVFTSGGASADGAYVALGTNSGLTAHGVLLGEGNSAIAASSAGTAGQVFTSGGASADGAYAALGTNSGLTAHGVLIGEGNSAIAATSAGTLGQPLVSGGASADPAFAVLGVVGGGTGVATLTGLPLFAGTANATAVSYSAVTAWTPQLQFGGGNTGMTFSTQSGFWQRIGSMVYINAVLVLTAKGSSTGNATISNLPVATGTSGALNHIQVGFSAVTLTANYTGIDLAGNTSSSVGNLGIIGSGQSIVSATDAMFADTSSIFFSGVYFVN